MTEVIVRATRKESNISFRSYLFVLITFISTMFEKKAALPDDTTLLTISLTLGFSPFTAIHITENSDDDHVNLAKLAFILAHYLSARHQLSKPRTSKGNERASQIRKVNVNVAFRFCLQHEYAMDNYLGRIRIHQTPRVPTTSYVTVARGGYDESSSYSHPCILLL